MRACVNAGGGADDWADGADVVLVKLTATGGGIVAERRCA